MSRAERKRTEARAETVERAEAEAGGRQILARARTWPANPVGRPRTSAETDAVLDYIRQDFAMGRAMVGVSAQKYAEMGGVTLQMASGWVKQASRLYYDSGDREAQEALRAETVSLLSVAVAKMLNEKQIDCKKRQCRTC